MQFPEKLVSCGIFLGASKNESDLALNYHLQ